MRDFAHMSFQYQNNPEASSHSDEYIPEQFQLGTVSLAKDTHISFDIEADDLNQHFYIIGRSGSGKSNLILNLAIADMQRGAGLCFIDPIGDAAETLLTHVPTGRDKQVVYFNAGDSDYPIGINPLYDVDPQDRSRTVSDILQMFEGIWHDMGWGPRMESIFRVALHTLIENPNCCRPSLLTVFRLLLDEDFRHEIKQDIENPQLLDWWDLRFDRKDMNERTRREWIEPVLNKIDALSLDPTIRNIIGQPRTVLNIDRVVAEGQILIVNLAQSKIGIENASFLGMLLISRIRQAAAKAHNEPSDPLAGYKSESETGTKTNPATTPGAKPPFMLTIDEAHSFPTMELTKIITHGRHHGLHCRVSHQHLEQFDPKIASVLRNGCGSLCVFAVGTRDGETIVDDLGPNYRDRTLNLLRSLGNGEAVLRLTRDGAPQPPPSYAVKITHTELGLGEVSSAINFTRQRYATDRLTAEYQIALERGEMSREEHLKWMARFKKQKRNRKREQRQLQCNSAAPLLETDAAVNDNAERPAKRGVTEPSFIARSV